VLATQNPIEQEGTYPLPEAQLDRFMFKVKVDYPGRFYVAAEDIRAVAKPVLRHRLITSFSAEADGINTDKVIIDKLIELIPRAEAESLADRRLPNVMK
jgi:MoxR-like ATPase